MAFGSYPWVKKRITPDIVVSFYYCSIKRRTFFFLLIIFMSYKFNLIWPPNPRFQESLDISHTPFKNVSKLTADCYTIHYIFKSLHISLTMMTMINYVILCGFHSWNSYKFKYINIYLTCKKHYIRMQKHMIHSFVSIKDVSDDE